MGEGRGGCLSGTAWVRDEQRVWGWVWIRPEPGFMTIGALGVGRCANVVEWRRCGRMGGKLAGPAARHSLMGFGD